MKITHIALAGILLLLVGAGFLLMQSENDRKMAEQNEKLNKMMELMLERRNQPENAVAKTEPSQQPNPNQTPPAALTANAVAAENPAAPSASPTAVANGSTPDAQVPPAVPNAPTTVAQPGAPSLEALAPTPEGIAKKEQELINENATAIKAAAKEIVPVPDDKLNPVQLRVRQLPALCKITEVRENEGFAVLAAGKNVGLEVGMKLSIRRDHVIVGKLVVSSLLDSGQSVADIDPKSVALGISVQPGDDIVQLTTN